MANEEIRQLTAETSLNAADAFVLQQGTDRATRATFSLMGGLVQSATSTDGTAAVGTCYLVTTTSGNADVALTLPASAQVGERIGFVYISENAVTDTVSIIAPAGDTLNGVTADTIKLYTADETAGVLDSCVVECTSGGVDPTWKVVHLFRSKHRLKACVVGDNTNTQSVSDTVWTRIGGSTSSGPLRTNLYDPYGWITDGAITPTIPGIYAAWGGCTFSALADRDTLTIFLARNWTTGTPQPDNENYLAFRASASCSTTMFIGGGGAAVMRMDGTDELDLVLRVQDVSASSSFSTTSKPGDVYLGLSLLEFEE